MAAPPQDPRNPLLNNTFRAHLAAWIGRRIHNAADVEDLVQETLLHTIVTADRHNTTDPRQLERIAQRIASNLVGEQGRQRLRKPDAHSLLDGVPDGEADRDALTSATQEHLRSLRAQLEPHLGPSQRALLAAYLDEGIVDFGALAAHLGTTRSHVGRMLSGIGKQILKLERRPPE